ncbi:MAG: 30S ribosome-binding factor RbfA [Alphaproteobacteria bacterium]|nr:30S ribosome-binding factor RbfA [Alphaproteobacteria bacterium]
MAAKIKSKAPTQRQLRVGEELRHSLSQILSRGSFIDPVLESVSVTITEIRVSPDLRKAKVFVVPLVYGKQDSNGGGVFSPSIENDAKAESVVAALMENQKQIRYELGRSIHLKFTPELRFFADEGYSYAANIDRLLNDPKIKKDIETSNDEA